MKKKRILLISLLIISCIAFEFLFCNSLFIKNKGPYVFSFARLFLYALLFFIEYKVKDRIINNRINYEKTKKKKNIIDIFLIICFIFTILADSVYIFLGKTNIMSQGVICILLCFIAFLYFFYSKNYKLNILMLCSICFIYSIVVTPQHAIDETMHLISSYNISQFDYNWTNGYKYEENIYNINKYKNYVFNEDKFVHYDKKKMTEKDTWYKPNSICKYMYIPSAIGILVSELLHGTIMDTFYLGRFFNAIAMLIGIALLLKITNDKKNIFIAIIVTPYLLLLGSTYNVDALGNLSILLFISYILNISSSKEKYLTKKNVLFLTILMILICLFKGASYFLIFLLLLLIVKKIPMEKRWLMLVYMLLFGLLIFHLMKPEDLNTGDVAVTGEPNPIEQLKFLFSSPIIFIEVYGLHILNTLFSINYYQGLLGTNFYPIISPYFLGFYLLFLIYMGLTENETVYKVKTKLFFIFTMLVIFLFTSTGLYLGYTGVGRINIEGYQTRYLFPIIPLILLTLGTKKIQILKDKNYDIINYGLCLFLNMAFIMIIVFFSAFEYWVK